MARLTRIVLSNLPLHIMYRGNNRQAIFETDEDFQRFREDFAISFLKSVCLLYAYVVMTNHFNLLLMPPDKAQLKVFMQSLANHNARYFNATRMWTGTIWEGRFKSCLSPCPKLADHYTYIYNAPGVGGLKAELGILTGQLNASIELSRISNVVADYGLNGTADWGISWSECMAIGIESVDGFIWQNHQIARLTDSLAVYNLLQAVSLGLDIDEITPLLKTGVSIGHQTNC